MGSLILSPGSWCVQGFAFDLQESVSPVLWIFRNQIPVASKVRFPWGSQPLCRILRLRNQLRALELLQQCEYLFGILGILWYIWVVYSLALWWGWWWPPPKGLMPHAAPPMSTVARAPVSTVDHCWPLPLQETLKHSKTGLAQSLVEVNAPFPGSWCAQGFCFHPPSVSGGYEVWF